MRATVVFYVGSVLLVAAFTTSLQSEADADDKTESALQTNGCCCA